MKLTPLQAILQAIPTAIFVVVFVLAVALDSHALGWADVGFLNGVLVARALDLLEPHRD